MIWSLRVFLVFVGVEYVNFRRGTIFFFGAFSTSFRYSVTIARLVRSFSWRLLSSAVCHMSASRNHCTMCSENRRPFVYSPFRSGWEIPLNCTVRFLFGRCGATLSWMDGVDAIVFGGAFVNTRLNMSMTDASSRGDDSSICAAAVKNAFVAGFIFSYRLASFGHSARSVVIATLWCDRTVSSCTVGLVCGPRVACTVLCIF